MDMRRFRAELSALLGFGILKWDGGMVGMLAAAQAHPPVKVLPLQDSLGLGGSDPHVLYKQKHLSINTRLLQKQNTNSSLDCVHRASK